MSEILGGGRRRKKSLLREYAEALILALLLALVIRTFVVQSFKIPSESMMNTLLVGDYLLGDKFTYGVKIPFTDISIYDGREPRIGIVLSQQYAVLGSRREHAVGFVHSLRYKIVDQHADVCLVALQHDRLLSLQAAVGVDARHKSLGGGLLIPGGAVYLTCKIQIVNEFGLQRVLQLNKEERHLRGGAATRQKYHPNTHGSF